MRTFTLILAGFALTTGCTDKADGTDTADVDTITDGGTDDGGTDDTGPTGTDDTGPTGTDDTGPTDTDDTGEDTGDDTGDTGTTLVDADGDGFDESVDCDDTDATVNPDAEEVAYDGVDNDCDESTLDDDLDGDGYGADEDCDDDPLSGGGINPDAAEECDGVDNNCDGFVDEDTAIDAGTWYLDGDEDGYGLTDSSVTACDQPEGYAPYFDDCDDADAAYNPGAVEDDCTDPNDYNCDGSVGYEDGDGDGFAACEECDDGDAAIYPGADEYCDEVDNNCDGFIDEDTALDASTWYRDIDSDDWGDADDFVAACDEPLGYTDNDLDCDDSDDTLNQDDADRDGVTTCDSDCDDAASTTFPGADETCNEVDDDCDTLIDEDAADASTWYADSDEDGYGDVDNTLDACETPDGYTADATDCDDADASLNQDDTDGDGFSTCDGDCDDAFGGAAINPDADEVCDEVDNDCDASIDEDAVDFGTYYADTDEDGYGDPSGSSEACEQPDGYTTDNTDCDDSTSTTYPGADETCNEVDDDCDTDIDEDATDFSTYYADGDEDGEGDAGVSLEACSQPDGYVSNTTDCDDADASLNTADADADGYTSCESDCDDADGAINPDADEVCDNVDNDCDGVIDNDASDEPTFYADTDEDGYGDASSTLDACEQPDGYTDNSDDCDDGAASVNPDADELCNDIDDDCDASIDEDAADFGTYYADTDEDGYGDPASTLDACDTPDGYTTDDTDCDDGAASVNPDADELCNDIDDDCDTSIDEDATDVVTYYADTDEDGYGDPAVTEDACLAPDGYIADNTDCDDGTATTFPGADETCNAIDDDCDITVDEDPIDLGTYYADTDEDGYGDPASTLDACEAPEGYTGDNTDCDDTDEDFNPGEDEACDDRDHDCDGAVDNDADGDGYSDIECGGSDCDDSDAAVVPELGGGCALGTTCLDILTLGHADGDGDYTIDPDGYGAGLDPFDVTCDMTTDGGGWTAIEYAADLEFLQHYTDGDYYRYFTDDFELVLDDAQVEAIQGLSTEGRQTYVGYCEHVIHYYYNDGANYDYAFGFRFFDGTETPAGSSSYSPYDVSIVDGCAGNGGEGGDPDLATVFEFSSALVPIVNVNTRDVGDAFPEYFGSPLLDNPAWLR